MSIDAHADRAAASYDLHGASLRTFARVLSEDPALADTLFVETIRSGTQPEAAESSGLRDLALDAFLAWSRTADRPARTSRERAPSSPTLEMLHRLPADQRTALALCGFGDHRRAQAAETLGVTPTRVARLLRDALTTLGRHPAP